MVFPWSGMFGFSRKWDLKLDRIFARVACWFSRSKMFDWGTPRPHFDRGSNKYFSNALASLTQPWRGVYSFVAIYCVKTRSASYYVYMERALTSLMPMTRAKTVPVPSTGEGERVSSWVALGIVCSASRGCTAAERAQKEAPVLMSKSVEDLSKAVQAIPLVRYVQEVPSLTCRTDPR